MEREQLGQFFLKHYQVAMLERASCDVEEWEDLHETDRESYTDALEIVIACSRCESTFETEDLLGKEIRRPDINIYEGRLIAQAHERGWTIEEDTDYAECPDCTKDVEADNE